jgi:hypothetical protein
MTNALPAQRPLFIASYNDASGRQFQPLSQAEHDRRTWFYRRIVDSYNLPARQVVLIISDYNDHALTIPLQALLHADGHIPCYAESTIYDARRTENFLRRLDVQVVVGINTAVLNGLDAAGFNPLDLFANRIVFARDEDAYQRLRACSNITLRRWMDVGPAIGMECSHGGGLHIDANEWEVELDNGEVVLTSRLATSIDYSRVRTGFFGTAVTALCDCGRDGVRVIPVAKSS